jgi:hypothetical protein
MPKWALDARTATFMRRMRGEHDDRQAAPRRARRLRIAAVGTLAAIASAVVVLVALPGPAGHERQSACAASAGTPQVRRVAPQALSALREDVARIVPQRLARLYEEGAVGSSSAWSDEQPQPPAVSPGALRPDGYEMRWWTPSGDDLVADVLVFSSAASARQFVDRASSTRCRAEARRHPSPSPPQAQNLSWRNPGGAAQADVYFARGARAYRLADAPAGQHPGSIRGSSMAQAFLTIDTLACLLRGAHCPRGTKGVPA